MTEAMTTGVSILMIVILGLTAAGLAVGVLIGWLARGAAHGPEPYCTPKTPQAEAYRRGRGLPPGAPIPTAITGAPSRGARSPHRPG